MTRPLLLGNTGNPDDGQSDSDTIGAIQLALEFRGLGDMKGVLDVIARLVRDHKVDPAATEPTRLLVEAVKIERLPG